MAVGVTLEDRHQGISPDQARADYLAWRLEEIRNALAGPVGTPEELLSTLTSVRRVLDGIPPQF